MVIKVDAEGYEAINGLMDVALKAGGIANFNNISAIMNGVERLPEKEEEKETKK